MEVETRLGVCKNSPAESTSPENGLRLSDIPIRVRRINSQSYICIMIRRVGRRGEKSAIKILYWSLFWFEDLQ